MTKNEFLDKLRLALNGKVSASLVEENVTYYNEYIDSQIRMGKSEQEVMELLGDPRLIARTIVQTNGLGAAEETSYRESTSYDDTAYGGETYRSGGYDYNGNGHSNAGNYYGQGHEVKLRTIPSWLWTIIAVIIIVCVISFIFKVVSFMLPIVLPVLLVLFLVKLFRDWLN